MQKKSFYDRTTLSTWSSSPNFSNYLEHSVLICISQPISGYYFCFCFLGDAGKSNPGSTMQVKCSEAHLQPLSFLSFLLPSSSQGSSWFYTPSPWRCLEDHKGCWWNQAQVGCMQAKLSYLYYLSIPPNVYFFCCLHYYRRFSSHTKSQSHLIELAY